MKEIDAKGYTCPQPLMMMVNAIKKEKQVGIVVDNETAKENILRTAKDRGWKVLSIKETDGDFCIKIESGCNG